MAIERCAGEIAVDDSLAIEVALARDGHAARDDRARLAVGSASELARRHGGHLDLQVDAVKQRAADPALVAQDRVGRAAAVAAGVAELAARARIHRRNQLERGGEVGLACRARDDDASGLERLAQGLERALGGGIARQEGAHDVEQVVGAARLEAADERRLVGARLRQDEHARRTLRRAAATRAPSPARRAPGAARRRARARRRTRSGRARSRRSGRRRRGCRERSAGRSGRIPWQVGRRRLTVTRLLWGTRGRCLQRRTRSRDSLTSVSARPTGVKLGSPLARCTSTVTAGASRPRSARLWTRARAIADSRSRFALHVPPSRCTAMAACIGAVLAAAPAGAFCAKAGHGRADGTLACNVRNRSRPSQRIGVVSMKKKKSYAIASAVVAAMLSVASLTTQAQTPAPASAASAPAAAEAKPDWTITGNAGLFSDYRFRGISQTNKKPAFQGGFDISHISGFYVGNWNSNVDSALYNGANLEMDFYGGYKLPVGDFTLRLRRAVLLLPRQRRRRHVQDRQHRALHRRRLGPDQRQVFARDQRLLRRRRLEELLVPRRQRQPTTSATASAWSATSATRS